MGSQDLHLKSFTADDEQFVPYPGLTGQEYNNDF